MGTRSWKQFCEISVLRKNVLQSKTLDIDERTPALAVAGKKRVRKEFMIYFCLDMSKGVKIIAFVVDKDS